MFAHVTTHSAKLVWLLVIPLEILIYGSYSILVNLSKVDGKLPYLSSSLVLSTELLKLIFSLVALATAAATATTTTPTTTRTPSSNNNNGDIISSNISKHALLFPLPVQHPITTRVPAVTSRLATVLPYGVPALCYCINNNLAVSLQHYMDPATYMVLGNFKIVTTAILFRVIMNKQLTGRKWLAVALLIAGSSLNSYAALQSHQTTGSSSSSVMTEIHISLQGLAMLVAYCFISGFAGVYSEFLLKRDMDQSVHYQNVLLYSYGAVLNFCLWLLETSAADAASTNHVAVASSSSSPGEVVGSSVFFQRLFQGYSHYTWALVVTQAICGLVMSLIMKHLNNMVRVFVVASAPLVTTVMAYVIFSLNIPLIFTCSVICVCVAVFLYNL